MKLGTKPVTGLKLGTVNISRAYLGSTLVWEAGAAPGGFPQVAAHATSNRESISASHAVTLPAGVTPGDLLIAIVRLGGSGTLLTPASGWTAAVNQTNLLIMHRVANGSEGETVTVTSSGQRFFAAISLRITGASEGPTAAGALGVTSPLVTAGWGEADNLFMAVSSTRNTGVLTPPASYDGVVTSSTGGGQAAELAVAFRELTAASDTPGEWAFSGTLQTQVAASLVVGP